jgi:hypothetical protein
MEHLYTEVNNRQQDRRPGYRRGSSRGPRRFGQGSRR